MFYIKYILLPENILLEIDRLISLRSKNMYPEVLNMDHVIQLTGYSKAYIYKLSSLGKIPAHSPEAKGGRLFFKRDEIFSWLTKHTRPTTESLYDSMNNKS